MTRNKLRKMAAPLAGFPSNPYPPPALSQEFQGGCQYLDLITYLNAFPRKLLVDFNGVKGFAN